MKMGKLTSCDWDNFSHLFSKQEKKVINFVFEESEKIWERDEGYDLAFLDYFSKPGKKIPYLTEEIENCISKMKTNGIIVVHDVFMDNYRIGKVMREVCKDKDDIDYSFLPYNYGLGILTSRRESRYGIVVKPNNMLKE